MDRPRGRPWQKGESGNPAGRRKGTRNRATVLRELLDSQREPLIQTAISMALSGNTTALKLCLERLYPPVKPALAPVKLPARNGAKPADAIMMALAKGKLAPDAARDLLGALSSHKNCVEVDELISRVEALEREKAN